MPEYVPDPFLDPTLSATNGTQRKTGASNVVSSIHETLFHAN